MISSVSILVLKKNKMFFLSFFYKILGFLKVYENKLLSKDMYTNDTNLSPHFGMAEIPLVCEYIPLLFGSGYDKNRIGDAGMRIFFTSASIGILVNAHLMLVTY